MFHNPEWMEYFTIASSLPLSDDNCCGRVVFHLFSRGWCRTQKNMSVWKWRRTRQNSWVSARCRFPEDEELVRLRRSPATSEGLDGLYVTFNGCSTLKCETNPRRVHENKKRTVIRCISITRWRHRQARRALTNQSRTVTTFTRV